MKKILSLVLVLTMVLGSFGFAFAAEETVPASVARVHAQGIFGVGGLRLNDVAKRVELATLVLRLNGYTDAEIEALKTASNFSDVPATYWGAPYVGLAVQEGLFTGDTGTNTFRPEDNATYAELLVVLLRALGYGEDLAGLEWPAGYVAKAAEVGIAVNVTADPNSAVTRLIVGETIDKALDLKLKDGSATLGQKLGVPNTEIVEPEPEELEVVSVSADNLKQVVVEFNKSVEGNEEAEKKGNYTVKDTKGKTLSDIKDVKFVDNTAVLTLEKAIDNQTNAVLVIDKKVTGEKLEEDVRFDDFTIPTVEEAEVIGKNAIKVVFSEPIDENTLTNRSFEVKSQDGKTTHHVRSAKLSEDGTEAIVEIRSNFKDGDAIVLTVNNSLKDYAEFRIAKTEIELEVVEDKNDIEVIGFRKASEEGITLIFNKPIKHNKTRDINDSFYHTSRKNTASKVTIDGNELILEFQNSDLPTGTAYIFIDGEALVDYWGNVNKQTIRYEAEVTADTKAPEIKSIETVKAGNRTLVLTFDKRLDKKSAEKVANYVLINDTTGKEVNEVRRAVLKTTGTDAEKIVTLTFKDAIKAGKYTIKVTDVEDLRGNAEADTSKSFTAEGAALQYGDIEVTGTNKVNGVYKIYVNYKRSMNIEDERYGAHLLENYAVYATENNNRKLMSLKDLADKTGYYVDIDFDASAEIAEIEIEVSSSAKVRIEADQGDDLTIFRVKDANDLLAAFPSESITIGTATRTFDIDKVEAVKVDELKVTFAKNVYTFDDTDLIVTTSAYDDEPTERIKISSVSWDKDKEAIIYLAEDLDTDGTLDGNPVYVYVVDRPNTKTQYDEVLVGDKNHNVADKIAPKFYDDFSDRSGFVDGVKYEVDTANNKITVTLKFTEDLTLLPGAIGGFKFSANGSTFSSKDVEIVLGASDELNVTFKSTTVGSASNPTNIDYVTIELETESKLFTDDSAALNPVTSFIVDVDVR